MPIVTVLRDEARQRLFDRHEGRFVCLEDVLTIRLDRASGLQTQPGGYAVVTK